MSRAESYDLVVRHGRVVDGTGNPAYFAAVAVKDGRIAAIGQIGEYQRRALWNRLGTSRGRVYEVSISDPVKRVLIAANLKTTKGNS